MKTSEVINFYFILESELSFLNTTFSRDMRYMHTSGRIFWGFT